MFRKTHFWGAQGIYKDEQISIILGVNILKITSNTEAFKMEASNADYKCMSILLVAIVNLPHCPSEWHAVFPQLAAELPIGFEYLLCTLREK